jgi:glycosyltransferase involved in cell wall biosynthesis
MLRVIHLIANSQSTEYFASLHRHTDPKRAELTVGSVDGDGPLQARMRELGVPTFALGADRRTDYPAATAAFARFLARGRFDVVQAHLIDACLVGLAAGLTRRTPLRVFTAHHSHEVPLQRNLRLLAADAASAQLLANLVVAPSEAMKRTLVEVHRVSPSKVTVIRHGIETGRVRPRRGAGERFRAEHGLKGRLVLGTVSRHYWVKNLDGLVRAFAVIAREEQNARLVIVGGGDARPLQQITADLGLAERVLILGPTADVGSVYAGLDLLVHPARAESFGLVIVEGMAAGLPVASTPVGVATEVIEDGTSGFLAADPTPASLADAIRRALACRAEWQKIGDAARQRAAAYGADAWAEAHLTAYEHALKRRS